MVTFSSHSDNIWCVQPEDTTSVGQPRSHVPDGTSQMVSTNDTVEETWHNINIIVGWITRLKRCSQIQTGLCTKSMTNTGTTITWWHFIRPLSPQPSEYYSTSQEQVRRPCPLASTAPIYPIFKSGIQNYFPPQYLQAALFYEPEPGKEFRTDLRAEMVGNLACSFRNRKD